MLQRTGSASSRPEGIADSFGLVDDQYHLTEKQAQAILDLRLHKLTGLEQDKIISEYRDILEKIEDLLDILNRDERLKQEIRCRKHLFDEIFILNPGGGFTPAAAALCRV